MTVEWKNEEWTIVFTDGSAITDKRTGAKKAAWGLVAPMSKKHFDNYNLAKTDPIKMTWMHGHLVEGRQTSTRAELSAILAAIKANQGVVQNLLIVTDSEYSINEIAKFGSQTPKQLNRTHDRDIIRLISEEKKKLLGKIEFIHVYSHQDSADEKRREKIETQRAKYGDELYEIFIKGNELADRAAAIAITNRTKLRDWDDEPMAGVDEIYIQTFNEVNNDTNKVITPSKTVDGAIHGWIRKDTQESIMRLRNGKSILSRDKSTPAHVTKLRSQARNQQLEHHETSDLKRSFAAGNKRNPKAHSRYITLFKLRNHALATEEKNARRASMTTGKGYKNYYKAMYPDGKCHFCKKYAQNDTIEDSKHLAECPSRPGREEAK